MNCGLLWHTAVLASVHGSPQACGFRGQSLRGHLDYIAGQELFQLQQTPE